jgi:hypothetical protein
VTRNVPSPRRLDGGTAQVQQRGLGGAKNHGPEPQFNFFDHSKGRYLTVAEAERALVEILTTPELVKERAADLAQSDDYWLYVLALLVNPAMREERWDAVGDNGSRC